VEAELAIANIHTYTQENIQQKRKTEKREKRREERQKRVREEGKE
jgi:hypothetical protein